MHSSNLVSRFLHQSIISFCVVLIFSGCSTNQLTSPETDVEEIVMADCFTNFYLSAWEDKNQNGLWDENEGPLEGVEFFIDGKYASSAKKGRATSDSDGEAIIDTWSPGECLGDHFTIRVETPDGFDLTTNAPQFHDPGSQAITKYQFGFFRP